MRDAIGHVPFRIFRVAHTQQIHMLCLRIVQERVTELSLRLEGPEDFDTVIGHAGDIDTKRFEFASFTFQLDQLALAEGSPIRGPIEEQQQPLFA